MTKLLMMIAILSVGLVAAGNPAQQDVAAELKKLSGTWQLVDELDDGKQIAAEEARKTKLIFDVSGGWKVELDGKVVGEGTAKIDPTRKPKSIDYAFAKEDERFVAIYELDGESFRHCGVRKGARPSEFSSKPGSGQILTTFHRAKD